MTSLRTIGNSQGVIIPKILIQKANLEGHEIALELHPEGLLIKPVTKPRVHWEAAIIAALAAHTHDLDHEWLDADLLGEDEDEG